MLDDTEVLLRFCEEQWTQARQTEDQRATLTNIVIIIAAAVAGLIAQKGVSLASFFLSLLLAFMGIFGAVVSMKFYERWNLHMDRARYWRKRINELQPNAQLLQLMEAANIEHRSKFPKLEKRRLCRWWLMLHILVALTGIICAGVFAIALH